MPKAIIKTWEGRITFNLIIIILISAILFYPEILRADWPIGFGESLDLNYAGASYEYRPSDDFESSLYSLSSKYNIVKIKDYNISASLRAEYRHTNSSGYFPDDLYKTAFSLRADDKKNWISIGVVSNSDMPYNSLDEASIVASAGRRISLTERHSLIAGLFYSSQRDVLEGVPMPMLIYEYKGEDLYLRGGFLFLSVRWKINDKTSINAAYFPIRNYTLSVSHKITETLTASAEVHGKSERYLLEDRSNKLEKLFLETNEAGIRLSRQIVKGLVVYGFAGYSFGSSYYKGDKINKKNDKVEIEDSIILNAGARYLF